jgi:hypothetical protein
MLLDSLKETWDTKAFQEAIFISMPAVGQQIHIQRLSSENKGVSPYIPLQAGYRSKKQGLTHIWLHGNYWLLHPQCYVTFFTFRFLSFTCLLCHPLPLLHFQNPDLLVSFFWPSFLLHYPPLWYSDPLRVKEHHLDLGVCIFIASLHGRLFSLYNGLYNGPDGP